METKGQYLSACAQFSRHVSARNVSYEKYPGFTFERRADGVSTIKRPWRLWEMVRYSSEQLCDNGSRLTSKQHRLDERNSGREVGSTPTQAENTSMRHGCI